MAYTQAVLYDGNIHETYAETRIKKYGNQKIKSPMTLPPDPDCVTRDIVQAHYQCCYWVHSLQEIISPIPFEDYGWLFYCESDFTRPVCFKGDQLPLLLATKSEC